MQRLMASAMLILATMHSARAADNSGSAALTSDYVFRGISQTQGDPALQASIRVDAANGLYGALWGSKVGFASSPDASVEIDYVAGWRGKVGEAWAVDLNATYFTYPSTHSELDYLELIATATWRDRTWLMLGISNDALATKETGIYGLLGTKVPLNDRLRLEFAAGYYGLGDAYGRSYSHGQATLAWSMHPKLEVRLTGHTTDQDARVIFGKVASPRFEAAIQASF